jgi:hypothetical protein
MIKMRRFISQKLLLMVSVRVKITSNTKEKNPQGKAKQKTVNKLKPLRNSLKFKEQSMNSMKLRETLRK